MKQDRFGYERCDGYEMEDFVLCELCVPDGNVNNAKLSEFCTKCGGYGEYPCVAKDSEKTKTERKTE